MSDATRERILGAAETLLKSHGAEGLTVEAAADLAGVSRKTVYNYFANRFALLDEAASSWMAQIIETFEDVVQDDSRGFIERLNTIVERGFAELRSGGRIMGNRQTAAAEPGLPTLHRTLRAKLRGFIHTVVSQAIEDGLVRIDYDARRLTWVLVNIVEGLIFTEEFDDEPFARADILRDSLRAVLEGILTDRGADALKGSLIFDR
ncbi:MAG: TetR/AcrR family transcriptional regulator [Spirochaetales bacterium]|nr:MAG: TetR/AcrR family transcriptional regulator [Spirochaetales bacterium]